MCFTNFAPLPSAGPGVQDEFLMNQEKNWWDLEDIPLPVEELAAPAGSRGTVKSEQASTECADVCFTSQGTK